MDDDWKKDPFSTPPPPRSSPKPELAPIYPEESSFRKFGIPIFFSLVVIVILISVVYTLVIAIKDLPVLILTTANIIISGAICLVVVLWYRNEALKENKLWYLLVLGVLIIFQCVVTDIFVGHPRSKSVIVSPTNGPPTEVAPISLIPPTTGTK